MGKMAIDRSKSTFVDASLWDELARSERAMRSLAPVIAHLLDSDGPSLISDAIVARLRGMLSDIGNQLATTVASSIKVQWTESELKEHLEARLINDELLIDHLYAEALELHLSRGLQERCAIDPVLSPLIQELIASQRAETGELTMAALASQSRFVRNLERMTYPLSELPQELFLSTIEHLEAFEDELSDGSILRAARELKVGFDEGNSRLGLLSRLVASMHGAAVAAVDLTHAGIALFASAASSLTHYERSKVIVACHEGQGARLAVLLKAAGASQSAAEQQLGLLGNTKPLPVRLEHLSQSDALSLLRSMREV